jgi:hypothetical protein
VPFDLHSGTAHGDRVEWNLKRIAEDQLQRCGAILRLDADNRPGPGLVIAIATHPVVQLLDSVGTLPIPYIVENERPLCGSPLPAEAELYPCIESRATPLGAVDVKNPLEIGAIWFLNHALLRPGRNALKQG